MIDKFKFLGIDTKSDRNNFPGFKKQGWRVHRFLQATHAEDGLPLQDIRGLEELGDVKSCDISRITNHNSDLNVTTVPATWENGLCPKEEFMVIDAWRKHHGWFQRLKWFYGGERRKAYRKIFGTC